MSQGVYILSCNNHNDDDWSRSALTLQGHEFCNDYVGNKAMITLNITGIISSNDNGSIILLNTIISSFQYTLFELLIISTYLDLISSKDLKTTDTDKGTFGNVDIYSVMYTYIADICLLKNIA